MAQSVAGHRHLSATEASLMQSRSIALTPPGSIATDSKFTASVVQAAAYYQLNAAAFTCSYSSVAAELKS